MTAISRGSNNTFRTALFAIILLTKLIKLGCTPYILISIIRKVLSKKLYTPYTIYSLCTSITKLCASRRSALEAQTLLPLFQRLSGEDSSEDYFLEMLLRK